jgi:hypothetical protein
VSYVFTATFTLVPKIIVFGQLVRSNVDDNNTTIMLQEPLTILNISSPLRERTHSLEQSRNDNAMEQIKSRIYAESTDALAHLRPFPLNMAVAQTAASMATPQKTNQQNGRVMSPNSLRIAQAMIQHNVSLERDREMLHARLLTSPASTPTSRRLLIRDILEKEQQDRHKADSLTISNEQVQRLLALLEKLDHTTKDPVALHSTIAMTDNPAKLDLVESNPVIEQSSSQKLPLEKQSLVIQQCPIRLDQSSQTAKQEPTTASTTYPQYLLSELPNNNTTNTNNNNNTNNSRTNVSSTDEDKLFYERLQSTLLNFQTPLTTAFSSTSGLDG